MVKLAIIGVGKVGSTLAFISAMKGEISEIVLMDRNENKARGIALDISQSFDVKISVTNTYEKISDSDILVITAGSPRKTGMKREDLLEENSKIIKDISTKVKESGFEGISIIVTNPVDIMSYLYYKITGFDRKKVIGLGGLLDSMRMRYYISRKLNIGLNSISALVIGSHDGRMIPLVRYSYVGNMPLTKLLNHEDIKEIIFKTKFGGDEILKLSNTSAFFSPANCIYKIIETIIKDKKEIISLSVYLNGEYNIRDCFLSVPVIVGKNGAEKILELELDENERISLEESYKKLKEMIKNLELRL